MKNDLRIFVSIIVPCYNHGRFLKDCLTSVINQNFAEWELIIVNDGSTDDSAKIGEDYSLRDSRIKLINKENAGLSSARNSGLQLAIGEFLLFLDADEFLLPGCLTAVASSFQAFPISSMIQTGYRYVDEVNFEVLHEVTAINIEHPITAILHNNLGPCHTIFLRRSVSQVIGAFDENLKSAEDWDYWIRAIKAGAIRSFVAEPLACYRVVGDSMSRDGFRMFEALKTVLLRSRHFDERITNNASLNKSYEGIDSRQDLLYILLTCIGVALMRGDIQKSVELFRKEQVSARFTIEPENFASMASYLTFRYWKKKSELKFIFSELYPRYYQFFQQIGLSNKDIKDSMTAVFGRSVKIRNRQRFGRLLGGVINRISNSPKHSRERS